MAMHQLKVIRPDSKGRITLGSFAKGVSGFAISQDEQKRIILEPFVEIPAREKWLFGNKTALKQVKQGLKDSAQERTKSRGSFAKYRDDEIE